MGLAYKLYLVILIKNIYPAVNAITVNNSGIEKINTEVIATLISKYTTSQYSFKKSHFPFLILPIE